MQALPPGVNIGVNADCSYDAEGMSLITDPDESESARHSDDEDDEETGYTCPPPAFFCIGLCFCHRSHFLSFTSYSCFFVPQFTVHLSAFALLKGPKSFTKTLSNIHMPLPQPRQAFPCLCLRRIPNPCIPRLLHFQLLLMLNYCNLPSVFHVPLFCVLSSLTRKYFRFPWRHCL